MDATGKLKNDKGSVIVFIALGIVVMIALTALAIDLGYMYVTKNQLQNAADAAALAGAARLDGTASFAQYSARHAAVKFAGENNAAGNSVVISSNYSNGLSSLNDVTVGHWNGNTKTFTPSATPVNAVEVRARRTGTASEIEGQSLGESAGGPISLFLSKAIGIPKMGAAATAIAAMEPKAGFYLFIGQSVCSWTGPGTKDLSANLDDTNVGNQAWTSFFDNSTSTGDVLGYLCKPNPPNYAVCGKSIYTTGGTVKPDYDAVQVDFYDPAYDASNKTFDNNGKVTSWEVIVPVSEVDDPTKQPAPALVWGYAKIRIIDVCAPGNALPTDCKDRPKPPGGACSKSKKIVIDKIECVNCANSNWMPGTKPGLVQ